MSDEEVPFVSGDEPDLEAPAPPEEGAATESHDPDAEPGGSFGRGWPFLAFAGLILTTLVSVYFLLHPRGASRSDDAAGTPAYVTLDGTVLRRQPAADAEVIETLSEGTKVSAFAARGPWVEIAADGKSRGFLPADAIERASDRDARQRREKTLLAFAPVYGVVGEAADVSLAPYPLAARGGRLAKGTVIAIHSVDHSYFAFKDKTWGVAFVSSAAVDLIPPDPKEPAIAPEKVKALKNLTILDLEEEPPPDEEPSSEAEEPAISRAAPPAPAAPAEPVAPGLAEGPVVIKRVEPAYPDLARRAGIDGTVELEVAIDSTGKVTNVEVVRGLPLGLSQAAADAVHQWIYRPARTAAGPVATRKTVRIRFVLRGE